jgi:L-2-hydroxyglutarate oxidase LhgO
MKNLTFDVAIVGGGVVGISIALSIKQIDPSLRVAVFEKENDFGVHASGRNSGVLHAGFYYSPDSLKAKFCVDGNLQLRKFAFDNGVNLKETGKVVVAKNALESKRLDTLYQRGLLNGVNVKLLDASELKHFEPLARTFEKFLWSPNTAVSDPRAIMKMMVKKCNQLGIELFSGEQVNVTEKLKLFVTFICICCF